ncbi:MAG: tyrosine-type recombinase/integrase [Planctomycetes bacterium]|nr:tyrosine-type recombinase/integrase [Planctomycetota bacterium]
MTINGKRTPGTVRATPEEAEADAAEMLGDAACDPDDIWTIARGLDEVYADLRVAGARPATTTYYQNHARIVFHAFDKTAHLKTLTAADLRAYIERRLEQGVQLSTIWGKELQVLDRICNLAVRRGALKRSPFADVRRPKLRAVRRDPMPPALLATFLTRMRTWPKARTGERDADILAIALMTGLRRAELARLRPCDVDLENGRLLVDGKNNNRELPIEGELAGALKRMLLRVGDSGLLIGSERLIEKVFARWKTRLGDHRIVPRSMRHGFGTTTAASDLPLLELQALMGHANPRQTSRYYHSQHERSRSAVRSIGDQLAARSPAAPSESESPPDSSAAASR